MRTTVPTLMVAGVALIGLYAGYRLYKTKSEDVKPEGTGEGELVLLGDPLKLTTNRYYRGRIRVSNALAPFNMTADRGVITDAMKALGFSNVKVWMNESELPSGWPSSTKQNAGEATRWFEGQWLNASAMLPRPADIEAMWISKPPAGATYTSSVSGVPCPPGKDCGCADCDKPGRSYLAMPDIRWGGYGYFNSSFANDTRG